MWWHWKKTLPPHGSTSSHRNQVLLPHTLTRGLHVGHCLHHLFSLPVPTSTTPFRGAQAIFRAQPFHVQYPTFSTTLTLHTYSPMKMEQTECSETLPFKLQTPGITQKKAHDHHSSYQDLWFLLSVSRAAARLCPLKSTLLAKRRFKRGYYMYRQGLK
jgi:hypothetical protein